ncbi:probable methyltransferase PMT11 [Primulina eburnea]|uniref:probable methyltransferase PMT11 n=1 Tax=Primulina eburnea TaxID=1245227 RepID=UPI003C6C9FAF
MHKSMQLGSPNSQNIMKGFSYGGGSNPFSLLKVSAFLFVSLLSFYFGKQFSGGFYQQLGFFSSQQSQTPQSSSVVGLSPNFNKIFDLHELINETSFQQQQQEIVPAPAPAPPVLERMGVVDESGNMTVDFDVGEFDPKMMENSENAIETEGSESDEKGDNKVRVRDQKFEMCPQSMTEYIPCLDNQEAIKKSNSTDKGEKFERHCPEKGKELNCLVPAPNGYKTPIPWPRSRDEVWFSNVPHARLAEDKGGQNWITIDQNKFKFPGGGTQFIHGVDQYLDQIEKMLPEIAFGRRTRVALDVGCGVASFGAYLLSRNVITLSVAPKDVHENQIQFALERGVPAMVAALATRRLLYPSQAFDLIHCSRCRINWTRDDGIRLLEVNRMLRAGGYFVWATRPVYKHEAVLEEQWEDMVNLTKRICWTLMKKEGYIAIWQKPLNNSCYLSREKGSQPPLCIRDDDPDNVWYVASKVCITPLPEERYGSNVTIWPERLQNPPDRLQSIQIDAFISKKMHFSTESKYWKEIIDGYIRYLHWSKIKFRNVLDMRAGFGGFAAALIENHLDCWVLNIVPVNGPNTLPVIYDRGLIGVMHDWCEPLDTYPRTYDLIHAAELLSTERKRCNLSIIMLEMDRILRPGGRVYIRDILAVMDELQAIAKALGWRVAMRETSQGPHSSYRILVCEKHFLQS